MSLQCGPKNPSWLGGLSKNPYCRIFKDKEFRAMIFERDHHQCQNCGITRLLSHKVHNRGLAIHHIDYDKKNCRLDNCITLCNYCNILANYDRDKHILLYKSLMNTKLNGEQASA